MRYAFRCDRCKRFYDQHDDDDREKRLSYQGAKIQGISLTDGYQNRLVNFDLCPECVKALDDFMNHPVIGEGDDK